MPRLAFVLLLVVGCGGGEPKGAPMERAMAKKGDAAGAPKAEAETPRKIIYTGQLELQVEDFPASMEKLAILLKEAKGYVSSSEETGSPGARRRAVWTVRVPAEAADTFRRDAAKLGEVVRNTLASEDVTERYYDAKAEVANKEAEEKLLRELSDKVKATKPGELVEWTRALATVRGEINQRLGQIRRWDKLTEFTTITVTLNERTRYSPAESPALFTRLGRTLSDSWSVLGTVGQGLLVALAAILPWAAILALIGLPLLIWLRRKPILRPPAATAQATLPLLGDFHDSPPTLPPE